MFENFMRQHGERLRDNGWPFIPIAPGEKFPGAFKWGEWTHAEGWQEQYAAPPEDSVLAEWSGWPQSGVGICCGFVVGIDIDATDPAEALAADLKAREMLGETPLVRIGNFPKRMLVYRTAAPFKSFNRSAPDVQILALGRQFVAFGVHPITRKPYQWLSGSPADIDLTDVPEITEAQVHAFMAACGNGKASAPQQLRPVGAGQSARGQRGTAEAIAEALAYIPNAELHYDDWVRVGMAIKGALGEDGRDLWIEWSASSSKDSGRGTAARKWEKDFARPVAGAGTIYYMAQMNGWVPGSHLVLNGDMAEIMETANPAETLLLARAQAVVLGDFQNDENSEETQEVRQPQTDFLKLDGVLAEMVDAIVASSPTSPQPFLALGASFAAIGTLMGRRYRTDSGLRSNLYAVGLAASAGGKNHARKWIRQALIESDLKAYLGPEEIASAQAVMTALNGHAALLIQMDEMGKKMEEMLSFRASAHKAAIWAKFTELYSQADGWVMGTAYANAKERPREDVAQPCCCVYGTTVPGPFWKALESGALSDGSLARWLIFVPEVMYPDDPPEPPPPITISDTMKAALMALTKGAAGHDYGGNLAFGMSGTVNPIAYTVPAEPAAAGALRELRALQLQWLRERTGSGTEAIIARFAENSSKIALVSAASFDPERPIIRLKDVEYAAGLVKYCADSTIEHAGAYVADSEVERQKKRVLHTIKTAGRIGISGKDLNRQTQFLRSRERSEILMDLLDAELIAEEVTKTSGRPLRVYRMARG